jgi:hypothetical protein
LQVVGCIVASVFCISLFSYVAPVLLLEQLPLKVLQVHGSELIASPLFYTGNVMISSVNPVVEWVNDWLLLIGMLDNLFFFFFLFWNGLCTSCLFLLWNGI